MAQLNIYVPDEKAARLRMEAAKAGLPLSRYVITLLDRKGGTDPWPNGYFETACGFLRDEFPEPADLAPEAVADMERE